ncbi:MAG: autotransporter-associated beta strand repeat-containing protein, partial [Planctomycetales bacterium]|nr:autotransporter-associated beta strand repeat-containing protein [Planctomycetales bacterium]
MSRFRRPRNHRRSRNAFFTGLGDGVYVPSFETLEDRSLLTAVSLEFGTLAVIDDSTLGETNQLSVAVSGLDLVIIDAVSTFNSVPVEGTLSGDSKTLTLPLSSITGAITFNTANSNSSQNANDSIVLNGQLAVSNGNGLTIETGTFAIDAASSISTVGGGSVNIWAYRNIHIDTGSSITTFAGDMNLSANGLEVPVSGDFTGIELNSASLTSTHGNVSLGAVGGDGLSEQMGVAITGGSHIETGGPGISIAAVGGRGSGDANIGVYIADNSSLTTIDGNVTIYGTGGSSLGPSDYNHGVVVENGSSIVTLGAGTVFVWGAGGTTTGGGNYNRGVVVQNANEGILSNGNVTIEGIGGGDFTASGIGNDGVLVAQGRVDSSSGSVTVTGYGTGSTVAANRGVWVTGSNARIESGNRDVNVYGSGGFGESYGIQLEQSSQIVVSSITSKVSLNADTIDLAPSAAISGDGIVALAPWNPGVTINLGGTDVLAPFSASLGISDAEIDRISAPVIRIGNSDAGAISVSQSIQPADAGALHLITGAGISQSAPIVGPNLAVQAGNVVSLQNSANSVGVVALRTSVGNISFENSHGFSVGDVDGVSGVSAPDGRPSLLAFTGDIVVNNSTAAIDVEGRAGFNAVINQFGSNTKFTLASGATMSVGSAQITADRIDISGTIDAPTAVTLQPMSTGRLLQLGPTTDVAANTLELSDAELDRITTSVLKVGGFGTGTISINQPIQPAASSTLHLVTIAGVTQTAPITVPNLAIQAAGTVNLSSSNDAGNIAIHTTSGNLSYIDSNGFSIGTVNGVSGVSVSAGSPHLVAFSGDIIVTNTPSANDLQGGTGFNINATLFGSNAKFSVANGATVNGSGAQITADRIDMAGTLNAIATVTLQPNAANRLINLGSSTDVAVNTLELSDAELDRITAGFLRIGGSNAGSINVSQTIHPAGTSSLHLITGAGVTGTGALVNGSTGTSTITFQQNGNSTYSGQLGGPIAGTVQDKRVALTKIGTGALTLNGANNHTGTTTVSGGTLLVNGSASNSSIVVNAGGVLAGGGATGSVQVNSGVLDPGTSFGTLHTGNVTFGTGSSFNV